MVAATSSAPSAEPCALPVFCLVGAGQPMMVRSAMNDGLSVTALAAVDRVVERLRRLRGSRLSPRQSTCCTCQPYAAKRAGMSSDFAMLVSSSIEIWLSSQIIVRLPSFWCGGEGGRLVADALLHVTVGREHVDVVVEQALAAGGLRVEQAALAAGRHRHADRVADALAERAGGGLDAGGVAVLRVARRQRAPGAQLLEVVELAGRSRTGRAGCRGSGCCARRRARSGRGRPRPDRSGRAA